MFQWSSPKSPHILSISANAFGSSGAASTAGVSASALVSSSSSMVISSTILRSPWSVGTSLNSITVTGSVATVTAGAACGVETKVISGSFLGFFLESAAPGGPPAQMESAVVVARLRLSLMFLRDFRLFGFCCGCDDKPFFFYLAAGDEVSGAS